MVLDMDWLEQHHVDTLEKEVVVVLLSGQQNQLKGH